jgi:hypothetical protein
MIQADCSPYESIAVTREVSAAMKEEALRSEIIGIFYRGIPDPVAVRDHIATECAVSRERAITAFMELLTAIGYGAAVEEFQSWGEE